MPDMPTWPEAVCLSQAYAAKQAEEEMAKSAPAAASSDTGLPREASTYAPPDWAGPPTGYLLFRLIDLSYASAVYCTSTLALDISHCPCTIQPWSCPAPPSAFLLRYVL